MVFLMGPQEIYKTIVLLCKDFLPSTDVVNDHVTGSDLWKQAYRSFLSKIQPQIFLTYHEDMFAIPSDEEEVLWIKQQQKPDRLDDKEQHDQLGEKYSFFEYKQLTKRMQKVLSHFFSRTLTLSQVFNFCIERIWFRKNNHAINARAYDASNSESIGLISISGAGELWEEDFYELLLHELTHQILFLNEWAYGHFHEEALYEKELNSLSAILKINRPLDKAFHSIVVATEIVLARITLFPRPPWVRIHPPTDKLIEVIFSAALALCEKNKVYRVLTSRGTEILNLCINHLERWQACSNLKNYCF